MPRITIPAANVSFDCDADDTILRAALRAGLGMAYECNIGSCANCRFELLDGAVVHARADAPGWNERDKGRNRYLGCQAIPQGDCAIKVPLRPDYKSKFIPVRTTGALLATQDHTHDIREFRFRLAEPRGFLPGQYALVGMPGVEGMRGYSMCNVTDVGAEWHFQIRRVPGGKLTTQLFETLRIGDTVQLDGPYGMAWLREDAPRDVLCLAGGSGLSPMISITRAFAASEKLRDRTLHFIYGGRTARDIAGEPMLRELPGFGTRIQYHPAISMPDNDAKGAWTGRVGFVHEIARDLHGHRLPEFEIYFAGPPPMAEAIIKMAVENKVPLAQLHFDRFF